MMSRRKPPLHSSVASVPQVSGMGVLLGGGGGGDDWDDGGGGGGGDGETSGVGATGDGGEDGWLELLFDTRMSAQFPMKQKYWQSSVTT